VGKDAMLCKPPDPYIHSPTSAMPSSEDHTGNGARAALRIETLAPSWIMGGTEAASALMELASPQLTMDGLLL
jgi:hypothetical protein